MTSRARRFFVKPLVFALAAITLTGCISPSADDSGRYTMPIGDAPVTANETPYSDALRCLGNYTGGRPVRIAVGQIADYTGKSESDNSGRKITQGAALMAMSALAKAGVPMVERFDTSVAELELKYANNKLIGDGPAGAAPIDYRKIMAGSIPGSNYYLVGGITELNFNIRSMGANGTASDPSAYGLKATAGASMYVMNIGLDLRLVDTNTLEVVDVVSSQKQIIGRQISAGAFDFLGHTFFDASLGESALEPIQLAVRAVIERAMLEMIGNLYHMPANACASSQDPLAGPDQRYTQTNPQARPATQTYAIAAKENSNEPSRQDPYRFYGSSDPASQPRLRRGSY